MKKYLNLVYDLWDEKTDKPIPNGNTSIYGGIFNDCFRFFQYYLIEFCYYDLQNLFPNDITEIKKCRINEVIENSEEKYYYVISHPLINLWEMLPLVGEIRDKRLNKDIITDQIKDLLRKNNNFFVIFLYEHECDSSRSLVRLKEFAEQNNISQNKFFVLNNNAKLSEINQTIRGQINVHSLRFIPHSSTKVLQLFEPVFVENKIGKFFLCLNRGPKSHRILLLTYLKLNNLIEDTNWSFIPSFNYVPNFADFKETLGSDVLKDTNLNFLSRIKYKESDYEIGKGQYDEKNKYEFIKNGFSNLVLVPEYPKNYENSYVNIVTESVFHDNEVVQITEKSFRPFYYLQLPIIVASQNHIKKMRELYGLDFFDDILDHSYDHESDPIIRLQMIFKEVRRIYDNKNSIINFYQKNRFRFERNSKIVLDNLIYDKDYLFLRNLL